jgi:BirA family biotin operon repressor/biotin-[acetyl-CoA-carboxylase] ligase
VELGVVARARAVRVVVHDNLDSTNSEAKRLVLAGEYGPLWIVARRQTAGRGRLGRSWESPPGNLHASLILSDFGPARAAPQLGFVAGLATVNALQQAACASSRLALKWPNDVLLDGKKLAGILLEAVTLGVGGPTSSQAVAAIIGIGVNCASAPSNLPYPATDLSAIGRDPPSAATLLSHLSDAMINALEIWACGEGFPLLRERWLSHAAGLGGPIRVALPQETIEGRFTSIDSEGRLVLATKSGERRIEAGDVLLGRNDGNSNGVRAFASERINK